METDNSVVCTHHGKPLTRALPCSSRLEPCLHPVHTRRAFRAKRDRPPLTPLENLGLVWTTLDRQENFPL